ncbi:hypothetical protein NGM37_36980, partial [Streptomyces sp. TRM76130]|nr:hypothetical protein [Streptomyces sp. TRM76130]
VGSAGGEGGPVLLVVLNSLGFGKLPDVVGPADVAHWCRGGMRSVRNSVLSRRSWPPPHRDGAR